MYYLVQLDTTRWPDYADVNEAASCIHPAMQLAFKRLFLQFRNVHLLVQAVLNLHAC